MLKPNMLSSVDRNYFAKLGNDVLLVIFSYLTDLDAICLTCSKFSSICKNPSLLQGRHITVDLPAISPREMKNMATKLHCVEWFQVDCGTRSTPIPLDFDVEQLEKKYCKSPSKRKKFFFF